VSTVPQHPRNDYRWRRVRRGLGRLSRHGAAPWWIRETAPALLDLEVVTSKAVGDQINRFADVLVSFMRATVEEIREEPIGVILWVVLALERTYVAPDGTSHDLFDTHAKHRRTVAGRYFRGGRNPVGPNAIRMHHEPPAFDWLTERILACEIEVSGFSTSDPAQADGGRSVIFSPGAAVLQPGLYAACDAAGVALAREWVGRTGLTFPPIKQRSGEHGWILLEARTY
jgi:hypothetical protein